MTRLVVVSLSLAASLSANGQVLNRYQLLNKYGTKYLVEIPTKAVSSAWTNRPWLGDASSFKAIRAELETRFARPGFDAESEFACLGMVAQARPDDAMAQFR